MSDDVIRPQNAVLLIGLQSGRGIAATLSAATHAIPFEDDSVSWNSPFTAQASTENTGSNVAGAPDVIGQAATVSFSSGIKGAGAGITYSSTVKPPLHSALQACGWRGQFTAAIVAAALTAGTTSSATLGAGFSSTAQSYRGMPLILSGGPGAGRMPLITDYSAGKVAVLADLYGTALDTSTLAALPANWTYAGTTPADAAARATDQPFATIRYYEDGVMREWIDCRGLFEPEGGSAKKGVGKFSFTGIYNGKVDASVPNAVIASHSAPLLVKGAGLPNAMQINRRPLPISRWSLANGGQVESPEDPNTFAGFGAGELGKRSPMFDADPLATLAAVRDVEAEIANFANYPGGLQFGQTSGNRWSLLHPLLQPMDSTPGKRGSLRSETVKWQALNPGDDAYGRDGDAILCFS